MFFLSPIKALYDLKFYVEQLNKKVSKSILFLLYLFVLSALFMAAILNITLQTPIKQAVEKAASYMPQIVIKNGQALVNNDEKLTITPEELGGYNFVFDTARTEPAYPTQMQKDSTLLFMNKNAVYMEYNGQFQERVLPSNLNLVISEEIIMQYQPDITKIILYLLTAFFILAQLIKLPVFLGLGFVTATIINSYLQAKMSLTKLFILSAYMQAPITVLYLLQLMSPYKSSGIIFIYLIIFIIYSHLVIAKDSVKEIK